jgi:fructokinase
MTASIWVLGEALMDCVAQSDGSLRPYMGGSPFNMARAAALRGASVGYVNPLSSDSFGLQMGAQLAQDGVKTLLPSSPLPTSLAVVQINDGHPSYGFYREGIADRDYSVDAVLALLRSASPGVLHTGSLLLVPPEHEKVIAILEGAKALGWTISIDVNLRPKLASNLTKYIEAVQRVSALADWIKASDEDLGLLGFAASERSNAPEIAAQFEAQGASRVALTFGGNGAWLCVDGASADSAVPPTAVVDTVGAGDTFWGNCLGDWVLAPQGASARVTRTLTDAMRAAAINCSRAGCQPPRYSEVLAATA